MSYLYLTRFRKELKALIGLFGFSVFAFLSSCDSLDQKNELGTNSIEFSKKRNSNNLKALSVEGEFILQISPPKNVTIWVESRDSNLLKKYIFENVSTIRGDSEDDNNTSPWEDFEFPPSSTIFVKIDQKCFSAFYTHHGGGNDIIVSYNGDLFNVQSIASQWGEVDYSPTCPIDDPILEIDVVNGNQKVGGKKFWAYAQAEQVELEGESNWNTYISTQSNLVGVSVYVPRQDTPRQDTETETRDWNSYFNKTDGYRITTCGALNSVLLILFDSDIKLRYDVSTRLFSVVNIRSGGGYVQLDTDSTNRPECSSPLQ